MMMFIVIKLLFTRIKEQSAIEAVIFSGCELLDSCLDCRDFGLSFMHCKLCSSRSLAQEGNRYGAISECYASGLGTCGGSTAKSVTVTCTRTHRHFRPGKSDDAGAGCQLII